MCGPCSLIAILLQAVSQLVSPDNLCYGSSIQVPCFPCHGSICATEVCYICCCLGPACGPLFQLMIIISKVPSSRPCFPPLQSKVVNQRHVKVMSIITTQHCTIVMSSTYMWLCNSLVLDRVLYSPPQCISFPHDGSCSKHVLIPLVPL